MSYRKKGSVRKTTMPVSLAKGLFLAWVITIVIGVIVAILVAGERVPEDFADPAAVVALVASSFACAMVAGGKADQKRMVVCAISGCIYYLSLICVNLLFFDGAFRGLLGAALTVMGCCVIAGLLQTRQKKQRISYYKGLRKA